MGSSPHATFPELPHYHKCIRCFIKWLFLFNTQTWHLRRMNSEADSKANWLHTDRSAATAASHPTRSLTSAGPASTLRSAHPFTGQRRPSVLDYLPFDPWRLVEALRRRWWWLGVGGVVLGLVGLYFGLATSRDQYAATVQLIRNEVPNPFRASEFGEAYRPRPLSELAFRSMVRSPEVLRRVSKKMQPPVPVKALSDRLRLSPDRNVDFIAVTLAGTDRAATVNLANLFAHEVERITQEMQSEEATETISYLDQRLKENEQQLAAANEQVQSLSRAVQHTEPAGSELRELLRSAKRELVGLLGQYTEAYPRVLEQRAKVKALEEQLGESVTNATGEAQAIGDGIAGQSRAPASGAKPQTASDTDRDEINTLLQRAQGKLADLEKAKAVLQSRQREARLFAANPPPYYRLLAPATADDVVRYSPKLKIAVLTLFAGFFGGASVGFAVLIAEIMDRRIKSAGDLQRVTRLPVLATLDNLDRMTAAEQADWAFRTWTALQDKLNHSRDRGIVCGFTSSSPGEGRSTWIKLLGQAASQRGVRVLTIATKPSPVNGSGPTHPAADSSPDPGGTPDSGARPAASASMLDDNSLAVIDPRTGELRHDVLSHPEAVAEQLVAPDAPPVVHIPLPGWVWNYERRKQWLAALQHWLKIENVVILVELPPASVPEAVLLSEHLPQLVWLSGGAADPVQTRRQLETLGHSRCNLVGAVLNRETVSPIKRNLLRWAACLVALLAAGHASVRAADADPPETAEPALSGATPALSVSTTRKRAPWQEHLTLGPGDVLNFALFGRTELTRTEVAIEPDGHVSYLQAQDILAAGLTIDELRAKMDEALSAYYRAPRTIITPVAFHSKKYFLLGSVTQKGVFTLDRPMTIIEAIARARGLETGLQQRDLVELADLQRAFLVRHGQRMAIDFEKLFAQGDLSQNLALEPDDYLFFPPADPKEVYVVGEVRTPGVAPYTRDTSALGAIASQGGFTDRAWKKRVLVVRGSLSHPQTFIVDAAAVLGAGSPDFKLEPRDIVYVHYRPWIKAEELLDLAATAFIQAAIITWTGGNVVLFGTPIIK